VAARCSRRAGFATRLTVPGDWTRYYEATGTEPRATLLEALRRFDEEEPRERLALDATDEAIARLLARDDVSEEDRRRLQVRVSRFENAEWPAADLVNSSFALPFCPPADFLAVWERIDLSLKGGGRFSGHLFGDRDGWSDEDDMTFHSRAEVDALLARFDVELLDEVEEDGATAVGKRKHWHLFHVVARR
jgi:tellurite methyltransferase